MLEIGCGSGVLVTLLQQAGFDAIGLELSPWVVELARQTFESLLQSGSLERQDFAPGSFDAILLFDLLEHLPDPLGTLKQYQCVIVSLPAGLLLIETPLFDDPRPYHALRSAGSSLLAYMRPIEHIHLFTTSALQLLLARAGCAWINLDLAPLVVAGPQPIAENAEATITEKLLTSVSARLVQALLDERHELGLAYRRQQEDRLLAFEQLKRALTASPHLALQSDFITTGQGWHGWKHTREKLFAGLPTTPNFSFTLQRANLQG